MDKQIYSDAYSGNPRPPAAVEIVTDQNRVAECEKIAQLRAHGEQTEESMVRMLREAAGKLGSNALLVEKVRRTGAKDVIKGLPEAALAGALRLNAKPPPARIVDATAYHCR